MKGLGVDKANTSIKFHSMRYVKLLEVFRYLSTYNGNISVGFYFDHSRQELQIIT